MFRFPRNLLTIYAANGLNGVVGIIAIPLTVKLLGVSGYGLFSIYAVLVSCILLADFGISKNLLRLLAETDRPELVQRHIRVALGLYVVFFVMLLAACPFLAVVVPRYLFPVSAEHVSTLRWMLLFSVLEFTLGVPASVMQTACVARQRFPSYVRFSLTSGLTRTAAIVTGAFLFRSPAAIAAMLAGRKVVELAWAARLLGRVPPGAWRPIFDWASFRNMLRQSMTLSASQILYAMAMNIGSPLVNAAFGLEGLGLYRAASDLAGKIAFVSTGVTLIVFPGAARRFATRPPREETSSLYSQVLRSSVTLYACFAGIAALMAPYILPGIGLGNPSTIKLFIILIVALSLNAHSLLSNELIQACGRYDYSVYVNACLLGALTLLFALGDRATILTIGWAWVGSALVSACVADGLLLRACGSDAARQGSVFLVKIAAAAASLGLALRQIGMVADGVAVLCALVLAALLWFAIRGAALVVRSWRSGQPVPAVSV